MVPESATADYRPRIADRLLQSKLVSARAVEIRGSKWCGKTETALQLASSAVMMQDPDEAESYILTGSSWFPSPVLPLDASLSNWLKIFRLLV